MKIKAFLAAVMMAAATLFSGCGNSESYRVVQLISHTGEAEYTRNGKTAEIYDDMNFENGDSIATKAKSSAAVALDADKTMTMQENTTVQLEADNANHTVIRLTAGEIVNEIRKPLSEQESYEVHTLDATIAVRGTTFLVKAEQERTIVYCNSGKVSIVTADKQEEIEASEAAIIEDSTIKVVPTDDIAELISADSAQRFELSHAQTETAEPVEITETAEVQPAVRQQGPRLERAVDLTELTYDGNVYKQSDYNEKHYVLRNEDGVVTASIDLNDDGSYTVMPDFRQELVSDSVAMGYDGTVVSYDSENYMISKTLSEIIMPESEDEFDYCMYTKSYNEYGKLAEELYSYCTVDGGSYLQKLIIYDENGNIESEMTF